MTYEETCGYLGLTCARCRTFIEFELPVTFLSPPICEWCEAEDRGADVALPEPTGEGSNQENPS